MRGRAWCPEQVRPDSPIHDHPYGHPATDPELAHGENRPRPFIVVDDSVHVIGVVGRVTYQPCAAWDASVAPPRRRLLAGGAARKPHPAFARGRVVALRDVQTCVSVPVEVGLSRGIASLSFGARAFPPALRHYARRGSRTGRRQGPIASVNDSSSRGPGSRVAVCSTAVCVRDAPAGPDPQILRPLRQPPVGRSLASAVARRRRAWA